MQPRTGASVPTLEVMLSDRDLKARHRAMWATGDYHAFAAASPLWDFGPLLVDATGIGRGQRVLDVAAGTGNVAIRAAERGAEVVASDLTPENFPAGQREAAAHGVELAWVEADAEALPFPDESFDVVTSSVGAIFAPHHQTVADELLRVCRPGGTIGLIALEPDGAVLEMFDIVRRYAKTPISGDESPVEWGRESHLRELFGDRVESLVMQPRAIEPSPLEDLERLKAYHPVVRTIYGDLEGQPERQAAFDREMDAMAARWRGRSQHILLIVARKRRG